MPELEDLQDDKLETLLDDIGAAAGNDGAARELVAEATREADEPSAEPAPAEPEPVAEPAQEPEPQEEPAPETPTEPPQEATSAEPAQPTIEQIDKELLEKRIEAAEALAKHWETVAGRHGGELGFIKQKIAELESRQTAGVQRPPDVADNGDIAYNETPPAHPATAPPIDGGVPNKVASWAIAQAMQGGYQQFVAAHPDVQTTEGLLSDMETYIKQQGGQERLLFTDDPIAAQRGTMDVLSEAYHYVAAQRRNTRIEELTTMRATQISNLSEAKAQATVSSSGSPAPQPPGTKALEDMTEDELDAVLQGLGEEESDRRASAKHR